MTGTSITTIEAKTGLAKAIYPDSFLVSLYRAQAPYRGCGHGCAYCDGRAEKYYVEGDFARNISVRQNLPDLVAADMRRGVALREYGAVCIGSGVTDIYQPVEKELELTRRTLEALVPAGLPLVILTKSAAVLRDFDLIAQYPKALMVVTVTTLDTETAAILEPGASAPGERLQVVRQAKQAGFFTGVMAMPLCPGISDSPEQSRALFTAAREAGADFIFPGGLTLRPGRQKDLFLALVDDRYPRLASLYRDVYRENRPSGSPRAAYALPLMKEWNSQLEKLGLPQLIPHSVYRELLSPPDSLYVLFQHLRSLYSIKGVDTRPLVKAGDLYGAWLKENRTALRRKRMPTLVSDPFPVSRILTEKLADVCGAPDGFGTLCGNPKLGRLVSSIINEGAYFDYPTLACVGR